MIAYLLLLVRFENISLALAGWWNYQSRGSGRRGCSVLAAPVYAVMPISIVLRPLVFSPLSVQIHRSICCPCWSSISLSPSATILAPISVQRYRTYLRFHLISQHHRMNPCHRRPLRCLRCYWSNGFAVPSAIVPVGCLLCCSHLHLYFHI